MENRERIQIAYFASDGGMHHTAIFVTIEGNLILEESTFRRSRREILRNPTFEDFIAYIHSEDKCSMMQSLRDIYINLLVQVPYKSEYLGLERAKLRTLYSIPTDVRYQELKDIVRRREAACDKLWEKYKTKGFDTIAIEIYNGLYTLANDCLEGFIDTIESQEASRFLRFERSLE